jgi:hypothetical protein
MKWVFVTLAKKLRLFLIPVAQRVMAEVIIRLLFP